MTHQHHQIKNERGPWSWVVLVGAIQCFAISNPGFCVFDVVATVMGGGLGHTRIGEERGELGSRNCCGLLLFCSTAFVTSSQTVFKFSLARASVALNTQNLVLNSACSSISSSMSCKHIGPIGYLSRDFKVTGKLQQFK